MKRYELPTPPSGKMTDIQAWNECVENSMAQLEHQKTRELFLDEKYSINVYSLKLNLF